MNINIEHITINVIVQPEHKPEPVKEVEPIRRGHRDPVEQLKSELEITYTNLDYSNKAIKEANRQIYRYKVAEKLRVMFGDDLANQHLAGVL